MNICQVEDCDRKHVARGYCRMHYKRFIRNGTPERIGRDDRLMLHKYEYWIYCSIIQRCYNPNNKSYHNYGGRGIKMSPEWRASFATFLHDMGTRPSKNHTIERINNDGNYEELNCRWATYADQNRNRRLFKNNKSGVTGVNFEKDRNKWRATIKLGGKTKTIGRYNTLSEAALARMAAQASLIS